MHKIVSKLRNSIILLLLTFISAIHAHEYTLVISSMFKDEAPYLKEWIEYHKMMGVEQFRLYNNDSSDDYMSVLKPYIARGEVTVMDWPSSPKDLTNWPYFCQWPSYLDAIQHFNGKSKWLAMIDVDEFLLPLEEPDMVTFLSNYDQYEGVVLSWQCFGTSYIPSIPPGKLMIETLNMKASPLSHWNLPVKSIVKPDRVNIHQPAWPPHTCHYLSGKPAVFPDKTIRTETRFAQDNLVNPNKAVVNHYVHRTESYFWDVKIAKKKRMENGGAGFTDHFIKQWWKGCNKIEDKKIHRFAPALRERMAQSNS